MGERGQRKSPRQGWREPDKEKAGSAFFNFEKISFHNKYCHWFRKINDNATINLEQMSLGKFM